MRKLRVLSALCGLLLSACSTPFPEFNPASFLLLVAENSSSAAATHLRIEESGGSTSVSEGGATDSYFIVLTLEPASTVTVTATPASGVTVNGSGAPINLTFDSTCPGANCWSVQQTITVAAVDDSIANGSRTVTISNSASSTDTNYSSASASVQVSVTDNDSAAVSITESGGATTATEAGATDSYTVVLTSEPTATVTITATADAQTRVDGAATTNLTFDNVCPGANCWSTAKTITVSAVDDLVAEGGHSGTITHSAASSDGAYNGLTINSVTTTLTDNDSAGVSITESGGTTTATEGGATDSYTVVLTSEPTATVTITATADAQTRVDGAATTNLTFDNVCPGANCWSTAKTITVSSVDDAVVEGGHSGTITHSAASTDGSYNAIAIGSVTVGITDNDTAGITVTESGGTTTVTEGGATDSYSVVLTSEPTANVLVYAVGDRNITINGTTLAVLTFTPANWNVAQNFNITAVNDNYAENSPHNSLVLHSVTSSDSVYNGFAVANLTVAVTDNDVGVILTESAGNTTVNEAALTDSYTLVLTSAPGANVDVTITPDSQIRVNGSGAPIVATFNAGNWNTPQSITVSGVGDALREAIHTGIIDHSVSSADGAFNGAPVPRIHVRVNEAPASCPEYHPDCVSNLALWVKADRAVTSGTKIERLHDLSLNLFFGLFQTTVAKQPDYVDNVLNGKPVMRFNGNEAIHRLDSVLSLGEFTACTVFRASATGFVYEHGETPDSGTGGSFLYPGTSPNSAIRRLGSLTAVTPNSGLNADNTWRTVCHGMDGTHAGHFVAINGTLDTLTNAGTSDPGTSPLTHRIVLGARGDASSFRLTGDIAELLIYSSSLSNGDRETVECYLANKYGLGLSHGCP